MSYDPIRLEIFKHLFASIAEEMGTVLRKSSYSPNIKERRDYSCAVFDAQAQMIAQAAHIPVHLGSMPLSVLAAIQQFSNQLQPGDAVILNDPFRGGTHLPDITIVSPVFSSDYSPVLLGFVASRAHHADVGGMTPGSMPVGRELFQEGLIIPPVKLVRAGKTDQAILNLILANVRTPEERLGDLLAQLAANQRGTERLLEMVSRYGSEEVYTSMQALLAYTERMTRNLITSLPDGTFSFSDSLDDDGITTQPVPHLRRDHHSGAIMPPSISVAPLRSNWAISTLSYAITLSAVYYVFRCLLGLDVPNNSGCLAPVEVIAPEGTVVNAQSPAAVAGGNVETSQRIVDVLLGALSQACPEKIPAASQGTMNNITIGGPLLSGSGSFTYYETLAGGTGATIEQDGASAVHSHMTNTLNTPVEALEYAYPLRVMRYEVRRGSGGLGRKRGGDGLRRDLQVLVNCQATLLTERRKHQPYGLIGGDPGQSGLNSLSRGEDTILLKGKGTVELQPGDIISIQTPGGGGYGFIKG